MSTNDKDISVQGSVLDKYVNQPVEAADTEDAPTITECYTEMPTHVAMLDLVDAAGNHTALPYHALEEVKFNPSEGITLKFHKREVTLSGRNLKPIYDGLTYQRVSRIELSHRAEIGSTQCIAITKITGV